MDEFGFDEMFKNINDTQPETEAETDLPSEPEADEPAQEQEEQNDTANSDAATDIDNEEDSEDEGEEEPVTKKQTAEENHRNAMRRRKQDAKREKDAVIDEVNGLLAKLGIKNPYGDGMTEVDSLDKLRSYVADKDRANAVREIKATGTITGESEDSIVEANTKYRKTVDENRALRERNEELEQLAFAEKLRSQYAQIKAFDPDAPSLEDLTDSSKNPELVDKASRLENIYDAYRLLKGDEVRSKQAMNGARAQLQKAGTGKEHMRSTSTRGAGAPTLTQSDIAMYRAFDPDVTEEEIRKYAEKDAKTVKHKRY